MVSVWTYRTLDVTAMAGRFYDGARARTPRLASPGPGGPRPGDGPRRLARLGPEGGGTRAGALPRGHATVRPGRRAGLGVHHPDRRRGPAQPVRAGLPGLAAVHRAQPGSGRRPRRLAGPPVDRVRQPAGDRRHL